MRSTRAAARACGFLRGMGVTIACVLPLCIADDGFAQVSADVQLVDMDPIGPAVLQARELRFVRISYNSEAPLRFQARGFRSGEEITRGAAMNPAPV